MHDTKIIINNMTAMVERAHAPYFLKKQALLVQVKELQRQIGANPKATELAYELGRVMGKIIRLNRKMKREGMFCTIVK